VAAPMKVFRNNSRARRSGNIGCSR
jgi:hypothetical protein